MDPDAASPGRIGTSTEVRKWRQFLPPGAVVCSALECRLVGLGDLITGLGAEIDWVGEELEVVLRLER